MIAAEIAVTLAARANLRKISQTIQLVLRFNSTLKHTTVVV